MFFEILSVSLIIIFFILGTKRGFMYEFFCCFKYILLMFLMKYLYGAIKVMLKLDDNISKNEINTFFIVFIIIHMNRRNILMRNCKKFKSEIVFVSIIIFFKS